MTGHPVVPKPDLEVVEGDRLLLGLAPEVLAVGEGGVRVLGGQRLVEVVPRVHPEDLDQGAVRQVQSTGAPGVRDSMEKLGLNFSLKMD